MARVGPAEKAPISVKEPEAVPVMAGAEEPTNASPGPVPSDAV